MTTPAGQWGIYEKDAAAAIRGVQERWNAGADTFAIAEATKIHESRVARIISACVSLKAFRRSQLQA